MINISTGLHVRSHNGVCKLIIMYRCHRTEGCATQAVQFKGEYLPLVIHYLEDIWIRLRLRFRATSLSGGTTRKVFDRVLMGKEYLVVGSSVFQFQRSLRTSGSLQLDLTSHTSPCNTLKIYGH